jgi:peptidoglycan/xylan/chitin deacetylase (PgdA/CDA1 family)
MIKSLLHKITDTVLQVLPDPIFSHPKDLSITTLCYHVATDKVLDHINQLYKYPSVQKFREDIMHLQETYNLLSYSELAEYIYVNKLKGRKYALITFDDGLKECKTIIRPILLSYNIPAIFFITTDFLDNKKMFYRHKISLLLNRFEQKDLIMRNKIIKFINKKNSISSQKENYYTKWMKSLTYKDDPLIDELCEYSGLDINTYLREHTPYLTTNDLKILHKDGFTIGAHSRTHPHLNILNENEVREQVESSYTKIREITGEVNIPFAFPFCGAGLNPEMVAKYLPSPKSEVLLFDTPNTEIHTNRIIVNRIIGDHDITPIQHIINKTRKRHQVKYRYKFKNKLINSIKNQYRELGTQ